MLGLVILVATALFVGIVVRGSADRPDNIGYEGDRAAHDRGWSGMGRRPAIGLKRETYVAFGLSLALLASQILAFWLVMRAYRLEVGLWVAAATLTIVHLGTAIPNAPANVGTYQFFCVVGLMLFGIDKTSPVGSRSSCSWS